MIHSFNIEVAKELGVEKAVLVHNICFWIKKNEANNVNFIDGRFWTYNSAEAFSDLFPYWKKSKIYRLIKTMEEEQILLSGNFNSSSYDRTKWYTIGKEWILQIYNIHFTDSENGIHEIATPIPDSNPDIKPNSKHTYSDGFLNWFKNYHCDGKPISGKDESWREWKRLKNEEKLSAAKCVLDYVASTPEHKYRKKPYNYLSGKCFNDEIDTTKQTGTKFNPNDYI